MRDKIGLKHVIYLRQCRRERSLRGASTSATNGVQERQQTRTTNDVQDHQQTPQTRTSSTSRSRLRLHTKARRSTRGESVKLHPRARSKSFSSTGTAHPKRAGGASPVTRSSCSTWVPAPLPQAPACHWGEPSQKYTKLLLEGRAKEHQKHLPPQTFQNLEWDLNTSKRKKRGFLKILSLRVRAQTPWFKNTFFFLAFILY